MSSVKNQTGMAEKEVENGSGQKLSGTVREFLERHPKEPVFMMTPGGYVYLVPEQIGNLLAGQAVSGSPCMMNVQRIRSMARSAVGTRSPTGAPTDRSNRITASARGASRKLCQDTTFSTSVAFP